MILSDDEIKDAVQNGEIIIDPLPEPDQYSASSLDLRLGDEFFSWNLEKINRLLSQGLNNVLDPSRMAGFHILSTDFTEPITCDSEGCCIVNPQDFILGVTHERIELPIESKIAARVEGRSSLARVGLTAHLTAPTIQAGWKGKITLEIVNLGSWPVKLRPYELRLCQLVFERVGTVSSSTTTTQFLDQESALGGGASVSESQ